MTSKPRVSPATLAHVEQFVAYYNDPAMAPHEHPPAPPTPEVACELTASIAQLIAIVLDYQETGELHADNPSVQAKLAAADLIDND